MVSSSFPIFLGLGYSFSGIVALTLPKYSKPFIVSSILLPYTAVIIYKYAKRWFWQQNTFNQWIIPTPLEALDYILTNSERNCQKVLKSFDKFCWDKPMMNLGDVKGKIVDLSVNSALASVQGPRFNMLELGGYCG